MRQLTAMAWKEWREVRWVVVTALVTFIALPAIAGIEGRRYAHGFVFVASPWVIFLGGILATVVGATTVTRDVEGRVSDFWQSRPMATWRWLVIKYLVGLTVVMVCCLAPVLIERWHEAADPDSAQFAEILAVYFPFIATAQYSLGFLCGSLMRQGGRAITLALAISLLAYFLPILLPSLYSMNIADMVLNDSLAQSLAHSAEQGSFLHAAWQVPILPREHMPLVVGAVALSAGSLVLAILAISRGWRIRAAQKLTYWSIGVIVLLVIGSAGFHLGTNLPALQQLDLEPNDQITFVQADGRHGALVYMKGYKDDRYQSAGIRAIQIDHDVVHLGPEISLPGPLADRWTDAWLPSHPDHLFAVSWSPVAGQPERLSLQFDVVDLQSPAKPMVAQLELGIARGRPFLQSVANQLYVEWWKDEGTSAAALIDVSDPSHPQLEPTQPIVRSSLDDGPRSRAVAVSLLPAVVVPAQEQLAASVAFDEPWRAAMAGDVLVTTRSNTLSTFRLNRILARPTTAPSGNGMTVNRFAILERTGQYQSPIIDNIIGDVPRSVAAADHLVYVDEQSRSFKLSLAHVVAFDVSDPVRPRPVGHFAAPGEQWMSLCPLSDGRLLAGGHKLYLIGAPPHH